jgi:hypothetical protein
MPLQSKLTAASNREQYIAVLRVTLLELATALCRLAHDEALPPPFMIKFTDRHPIPWGRRIAELRIDGTQEWIKEPEALHLSLPISGTLVSGDGRRLRWERSNKLAPKKRCQARFTQRCS